MEMFLWVVVWGDGDGIAQEAFSEGLGPTVSIFLLVELG